MRAVVVMDVIDFISAERLRTYDSQTDTRKKAIALHNHTLQVGSSLMSMIALIELSLRNATNLRLSENFSDEDWLVSGKHSVPLKKFETNAIKAATGHAQKALYSKLSYKEKALVDVFAFPLGVMPGTKHKDVVKKRQAMFAVSHGQVISQTTFSFWKRLYSHEYEQDLWKPSLKRVFPRKHIKRSEVASALEVIYAIRNRVAHHEPVYDKRLDDVIKAIDFIRENLGAKQNEGESNFMKFSKLHHLRLRMDYVAFLEAWATLT
jgi:hypothetical protein